MKENAAAADSRGVRLDDAQHHLHGDGGIDGGTAAPQYLQAGFDCQRMGRRHHRLRCRQRGLHTAGGEQHRPGSEQSAQHHVRRATMKSRRNGKSVMPSVRAG